MYLKCPKLSFCRFGVGVFRISLGWLSLAEVALAQPSVAPESPGSSEQASPADAAQAELESLEGEREGPVGFPSPNEPMVQSTAPEQAAEPSEAKGKSPPALEASRDAPTDVVETIAVRRTPTKLSFSLTTEEVRTLPGAFGDAFRAVGTLPGLTPIISGLPFFYIRGAPPGNVGYLFNGIRVPTLFHVGIGPSVLQPAFVNAVELHPGAYEAHLGQFSGGFITASETPPAFELRSEANLRPFDVGGFVETPFADGKGTFAIGGRYSYTAALLSLVSPDAVLDYRDFQARLTYDLTSDDRLTVFTMGSYDVFGSETNGILEVNYGVEYYRLSAIHERELQNGLWRTQLTVGYDRSIFGFDNASTATSANGRTQYETRLLPELAVSAGAETNVQRNRITESEYLDPGEVGSDFFQNTFPSRTDTAVGGWISGVWDPTEKLRLTPGLRFDWYKSGSRTAIAVEPRLRADYTLTPSTGLIAALGLEQQPPSFVIPLGGLTPAGLGDGLQRTIASSFGVKTNPWPGAKASATVFYNHFDNMTDALGASSTGGGPDSDINERSAGYATGLELNFLGKLTSELTGVVSYTLSRSVRDVARRRVYSAFDRTHVVNFSASYRLGNGYLLGGRYLGYSGVPFPDDRGNASVGSPPDRARFFHRLDARFEKRWDLNGSGWMALVVEGLNVTLSAEELESGVDAPVLAIPSIGFEGGF